MPDTYFSSSAFTSAQMPEMSETPGYEDVEEFIAADDIPPSANELIAVSALLGLQDSPTTEEKATQVTSGDLKLAYLIKADDLNDRTLYSLTGVPSLSLLNYLAEIVSEEIKFSNKHHLPVKERIILTMMRMYLNISFSSLSIFFGCCIKTVCNIFCTVIPILSSCLQVFIKWAPKEEVIANLPHAFKLFQNVRAVVDCSEILVQKPKCLNERLDMYSHYYKDLTIKFMVCATPSGLITFIGSGYGGKTSDRQIFLDSNVLEMLEPHVDAVMVDKGFLIDEVCAKNFIEIVRPAFLRMKPRFPPGESKQSRKISSARVHIERVIQRIKVFGIFKSTYPYSLLKFFDHMLVIAAGLTNLSGPILGDDKFLFNTSTDDQHFADDDQYFADDYSFADDDQYYADEYFM